MSFSALASSTVRFIATDFVPIARGQVVFPAGSSSPRESSRIILLYVFVDFTLSGRVFLFPCHFELIIQ